ncbi:hypothetical protein PG993_002247 [Apiospora rasikravindrae]|uniref:C2H2-type domain-containing protein n=1 Tax=Apiospora rasikravindrae TaxID=990691 RepID=A0ABR1TWB4_9PEZI
MGSISRYSVDMGMFKPPHEHVLPWRAEWRPEDTFTLHQSQQNMAMMPYYAENDKWCSSNAAEMSLMDHGGKPWSCRTCQTVAYIRDLDWPAHGRKHVSEMDLIISRPIVQPTLPSDPAWLAQLERPEGSLALYAHRITWCEDAACGISKGGRKEALLLRMLEMAMSTPERHELYGICPMERSKFLNRVFWWFWSAPVSGLTAELQSYWYQTEMARKAVHRLSNSVGKPLVGYGVLTVDESTTVGYASHDPDLPHLTPDYLETLLPHIPEYRKKAAAALLAVTFGDFTAAFYESSWPEQVVLQNMDLYEAHITSEGRIYESEPGTWTRAWSKVRKIIGNLRFLL